jgi:hypothetical protein
LWTGFCIFSPLPEIKTARQIVSGNITPGGRWNPRGHHRCELDGSRRIIMIKKFETKKKQLDPLSCFLSFMICSDRKGMGFNERGFDCHPFGWPGFLFLNLI